MGNQPNPQPNALAQRGNPYERFKGLIKSENVQDRFRQILSQRSPEFLASLLSLVGSDRNLQDCDPATIFTSAAKAAILRLPISKELGFAYIVPFKHEATFIIGYRGLIQLAIRSGQYASINATPIYQGEEIAVDRLTGMAKLGGQRAGDAVTGYVSYFRLKNGFEKVFYMDRGSMERHAQRYSKSYGNPRSAWTTHFDEMGQKTVLRQLLSKYGLLSIEMVDDDADQGMDVEARILPKFDDLPANPLEGDPQLPAGEPVSAPEPAPAGEPESQNEPPAEKAPEAAPDHPFAAFDLQAQADAQAAFESLRKHIKYNPKEAQEIVRAANGDFAQAYRSLRRIAETPAQ